MPAKAIGSKRALCVGINDYPGTGNDLSGCVNDANDWKDELAKRGYSVTSLLNSAATKKNMVAGLKALISGAKAGDQLVFTYSGHGSWIPDDSGDEPDGRDEMLCPYDVTSGQFLLDDELAALFSQKPAGVNFYFISDSCHSGTVAKFAPMLLGGAKAPQVPKPRFLPPGTFLKSARWATRLRRVALAGKATRQKYPVLLAAGCQDVEYSYDANFNHRANGAFTYVALRALKKGPKKPKEWMTQIRNYLPSSIYPQTPRLYGSSTAKNGAMF